MAELPELTILRKQMDEVLSGTTIAEVEVLQEKCLNISKDKFVSELEGSAIISVMRKGKWLIIELSGERYLLLNLGMGADLWYYRSIEDIAGKYQVRIGLDTGAGFTCRFWWFGYVKLLTAGELPLHKETQKLGPSPIEIDLSQFTAIARRIPRSSVKSLILDQSKLSGIGNAYSHDILWKARLHPNRRLGSLSNSELEALYGSIRAIITRAIELGGIEDDFYRNGGNHRNWDSFSFIGYKEGKPCPDCSTPIIKIKTGPTATYICPRCQCDVIGS